MKPTIVFATLFGIASVCARAAEVDAAVLYNQPVNYLNAWTSEDHLPGVDGPWRTYDDFVLASDAAISGLAWVGAYVDGTDTAPPAPDSTAFTFRVYADAAGSVGSAVFEQSVPFADVTRTYLGSTRTGACMRASTRFRQACRRDSWRRADRRIGSPLPRSRPPMP